MEFDFHWTKKEKNKEVWLKSRNSSKDWPNQWTKAYLTNLGKGLAYDGGRIAIFKADNSERSGYIILQGNKELKSKFLIKDD